MTGSISAASCEDRVRAIHRDVAFLADVLGDFLKTRMLFAHTLPSAVAAELTERIALLLFGGYSATFGCYSPPCFGGHCGETAF